MDNFIPIKNLKFKDVITRAGAGILYILYILLGVLGGKILFLIIFGLTLGVALFEFYRMVEKDTSHAISKIFNIVMGVIIYISVALYIEGITAIALPASVLLYLLILIFSSTFIKRKDILHGIIYSVFGQMYITMALSLLMILTDSAFPVIALFVYIWVNDTAAYFFGSLIGKHKLHERISPKKSIEGFVAGILFTVLASFIFAYFFPQFSLPFWIGLSLIVSLFGTLGDLFESLIKRTCDVKDAGNIIPGHGGILDRIDSLLVAVPAVFMYLLFFQII